MAAPVLDYVGVLDTSNATSGIAEFKITFPVSIKALMFEYKYQPVGELIVDPTDFISGFIYPDAVEPAQNESGSESSYLIPLPTPPGLIDYNVAIRIYSLAGSGSAGSSYTAWSNDLALYRPPSQPVILTALYDALDYYYSDTYIYLNLDPSSVDLTNYDVKYIASYYYVKRGETSTTWETTALLSLDQDASGNQIPRLAILAKGDASVTYPAIYIAINKVLPFIYNAVSYYSLSEISNTATATQAEITPPTMDSVTYEENQVADQSMVVVWTPPISSYITTFAVEYYNLEVNIHPIGSPLSTWTQTGGDIPPFGLGPQTYVYHIDVSNNPQGYTFDFRVQARLVNGADTGYSNVLGADQVNIEPPVLCPLTYLEYNEVPYLREQKMVLDWTPAYNSMQPLPDGFTASAYEVYLSVDGSESTLIATLGDVLTYTYDITDPSYVSMITNLNFSVKAVITQTGGATSITTSSSNEQNLNTYTYATAPRNLTVNSVIYEGPSDPTIDVVFTWENVLNPGLGYQEDASACVYHWKVWDPSTPLVAPVAEGNVDYDPYTSGNKYTIITSYTAEPYSTYVVEVYLVTPDTNSDLLLNGLSAVSPDLIPVAVPFIYDVVVGVDFKVSFKVLSSVFVGPQAVFVYGTNGVPEAITPFSMLSVPYVIDEQGNYNWTFTDANTPVILPPNYLGFAICVSNSAGVGYNSQIRPIV